MEQYRQPNQHGGQYQRYGQYANGQPMNNAPCANSSPCEATPYKTESCKEEKTYIYHPENGLPIGMCYVPWQEWGELYDPRTALKEGTMFKELNLIFCGKRGGRR